MAHTGFHATFTGSGNQGLQVAHNAGNIETHHYPIGKLPVPVRLEPR
jgi:hypothetical protein